MNQYLTQEDCISKLGKRIQNLRSDRPDEWTMDDFIRDADNMQLKIDELEKQHVRELDKAESIIHDLVDLCITEIVDVEDVSVVAAAQEWLAQ